MVEDINRNNVRRMEDKELRAMLKSLCISEGMRALVKEELNRRVRRPKQKQATCGDGSMRQDGENVLKSLKAGNRSLVLVKDTIGNNGIITYDSRAVVLRVDRRGLEESMSSMTVTLLLLRLTESEVSELEGLQLLKYFGGV